MSQMGFKIFNCWKNNSLICEYLIRVTSFKASRCVRKYMNNATKVSSKHEGVHAWKRSMPVRLHDINNQWAQSGATLTTEPAHHTNSMRQIAYWLSLTSQHLPAPQAPQYTPALHSSQYTFIVISVSEGYQTLGDRHGNLHAI